MTWTFTPPGYVTDFTDPGKWHEEMEQTAEGIIFQLAAEVLGRDPQTLDELDALRSELGYADPTKETVPDGAETLSTAQWFGFPQSVERRDWPDITQVQNIDDPQGFYRAVEDLGNEDIGNARIYDRQGHLYELPVRHRQDEYLEWQVSANQREITFVSEGYDYFSALFDADEDAVVSLYRKFLRTDAVTADDLRAPQGLFFRSSSGERTIARPGGFNPRNRFNIYDGICHLSHRANSLGAEVNLAGVSALARVASNDDLVAADNAERIICCSRGGESNQLPAEMGAAFEGWSLGICATPRQRKLMKSALVTLWREGEGGSLEDLLDPDEIDAAMSRALTLSEQGREQYRRALHQFYVMQPDSPALLWHQLMDRVCVTGMSKEARHALGAPKHWPVLQRELQIADFEKGSRSLVSCDEIPGSCHIFRYRPLLPERSRIRGDGLFCRNVSVTIWK